MGNNMSNDKLIEALREADELLCDFQSHFGILPPDDEDDRVAWERIKKCRKTLAAHAAEAAQPVEAIGCLSIRHFRGCDSMVNHDFDYFGSLPDGDYRLYTHPQQPAQDTQTGYFIEGPHATAIVHNFNHADPVIEALCACTGDDEYDYTVTDLSAMAKESGR